MNIVGNRWYKCDFHLHTMQSNCYNNKSDTVKDWVEEVKRKGLDCIAVTDHNDYRKINEIKSECNEKGIVVFPGVELTCDTSKIHMLVLFDVSEDENIVRDFLVLVGIDTKNINEKEKYTSMSVKEVCKIAKEKGGIVIAAHIDEFNGINSMNDKCLKELLNENLIDAVQVVNNQVWDVCEKKDQIECLKLKYKKITESDVDKWRKIYTKIKDKGIAIMRFSDNPMEENNSEHGLWGIGKDYTWIKMGSQPNLEGLKQATLSSDLRIKTSIECVDIPEKEPNFWIEELIVKGTKINGANNLDVKFNPQLNTIIGGRGSGKSTIIRVLYGAMGCKNTIGNKDIDEEQKNFYKKYVKEKKGIFDKNSSLEVYFKYNMEEYHLHITAINSVEEQTKVLYKVIDNKEQEIEFADVINKIKLQIYPQKSIYEIAKIPNDLLNIIDKEIDDFNLLKDEKEKIYNELLNKIREQRELLKEISKEKEIRNKKNELNDRKDKFEESGYIKNKQDISNCEQKINNFKENINYICTQLNNISNKKNSLINIDFVDEKANVELKNIKDATMSVVDEIIQKAPLLESNADKIDNFIKSEYWQNKRKEIDKLSVENADIDEVINELEHLDEVLRDIEKKKNDQEKIKKEIDDLKEKYQKFINDIRERRTRFIKQVIDDSTNIKVELLKNANKEQFCKDVIDILQKNSSTFISEDVNKIADKVFKNKSIEIFREEIEKIRKNRNNTDYSRFFCETIVGLQDEFFDKLLILEIPDALVFKYKPDNGKKFKELSIASAGQKATAILTFISSYGETPLLLDQPEDDLDNKMVYELVVRMLQKSKNKRQLIIATHNANIPVNGDAENIIAMNSDRVNVEIKSQGTMDNKDTQDEICDVMEGTKYAFEMRAKKYHLKIYNK